MESPTSEEMGHQLSDLTSYFKSNATHFVVEFVHEKASNGKASIELVPREWLDRVDEKWICYYPPKKDWSKVNHWTKISKNRDTFWKGSEICILKEAANYEKGLRRLKKFFTDDAVLSTGEDVAGEIEAQGNHLRTLDVTETQNELEDLPTLIPNYPVATGVVSNALDTTDFGQILVTVVSQIQHTEKRILREMEAMKRSILYDTQVRADEVKNTVLVNSVSSLSTDVSQHVERLGFVLPCTTVESFEAFDAAIAVDKEKRKSLDCIMIRYTIGNNEFTSSLSAILSSLLAKDVQLQYSACGREIRGIKKKNFSETETFKCLDAVLTEKYSVSTKTIISKMSRWFIGAGDRGGGRKQRK